DHQRERELKQRTLQNTMAALRTVLTAAVRGPFAEHRDLSNAALGLSGASRDGTHKAVGDADYQQALEQVLRMDASGGIAAVMALQRRLGLRALEALCPRKDTLSRWEREILEGEAIHVIEGTKGGRPRRQTIIDPASALAAVREALQVLSQNQVTYLVNGKTGTLKSAYDRYHRSVRKAGLKGSKASHGLRYAWVREAVPFYRAQGYSEREASVRVAQDLGHGDGRGRYVRQVYYGRRREDA
ncbi:DNA-binding prophage protein, partial [Acidithiobacillus sp. GGI-221]